MLGYLSLRSSSLVFPPAIIIADQAVGLGGILYYIFHSAQALLLSTFLKVITIQGSVVKYPQPPSLGHFRAFPFSNSFELW